ncbi:MAG: arabinose-5-phosphate isomerase [Chthoniobacter sp.]|jgi:arabinose-5-phosphate isomerase|nr:arabinose-5-phosphate isomerase [Chthoniobacter sp.]
MDFVKRAKRVIDLEVGEIQRLRARLDDSFANAVKVIKSTVERRNKVVVMGVGKSGHVGEKIAATLTSTGSPAVVLNSLNALHGDLGVVADGDAVLALSYSGETDELINVLPALARFDVKIVSMTGNPGSFLAQNSDVHLDVNVEQEACPLNLAPTSSTTAMLVLGDALAMVLLEARGFNKEDFARFHPGGKLGRTLLLKVSQIMRGEERIARVTPEALIREVLHEMAKKRAGSAVVIAPETRALLGIFTHGDFGRHFQKEPQLLEKKAGDYMTRNPITIRGEKLAAEVLHILEHHAIDDLVVVDDQNRPIGVVDSQDLARFKLL